MDKIKERVEHLEKDSTTINFSITKCPIKVYKEFVAFSHEESNDNYSFALKLLLDGMRGNVKEAALYQQYLEVKDELASLKSQIEDKKDEKKGPKTMGSR